VASKNAETLQAAGGDKSKELDKLKSFFTGWHSKDLMHTWEIDPTEIEFIERVGEGTSCSVYRGTYRGQEVALKVLKDINQKQLTGFTKEFDIISQFRSPYVVFFFGACIQPIPVMVLGYCSKGSLFHVLNNPFVSLVISSGGCWASLLTIESYYSL
jgi:serine/threonine protein kinase